MTKPIITQNHGSYQKLVTAKCSNELKSPIASGYLISSLISSILLITLPKK